MAKKSIRRIGVLTGGGDCPGLNAVIRAVAKTAMNDYDLEVIGILDGYEGMVEKRFRELRSDDVSGILFVGGTILGTSNKANPFRWAVGTRKDGKVIFRDRSEEAIANLKEMGIDAVVCIGGDGTLSIANELRKKGVKVTGVPKTIDNDLAETDVTFGFDTAVQIATEAIDRLHTTAQSHQRVMVVELMGRYAGWLTLHAGVAGGGDIILLPEIPYDIKKVVGAIEARRLAGRRFSIVVVSEGARPKGGKMVVNRVVKGSHDPVRLGGIGNQVAADIEELTGYETRVAVLGHLQRGGTPTAFDRVLATRFGTKAMRLVADGRFGKMVALKGWQIRAVPIERAVCRQRTVPLDLPLLATARSVGTCLGD